jgi:hypothetical protein
VTTRFVSPDPLFAVDMEKCIESIIECNLYQYTGNNPVNFLDVTGLEIAYSQVIGHRTFNLVGLELSDVAKTTTQESNVKAHHQTMGLRVDTTPAGETVYLSNYGDFNQEYFDAIGAKTGENISDLGSKLGYVPVAPVKGVGTGLEVLGAAIQVVNGADLVDMAIKEALSTVGGYLGVNAAKSKNEINQFQEAGADFLGNEIGAQAAGALLDVPVEITPSNQYSSGQGAQE